MKHATKGNAQPARKPRVYFTCHPEDFEIYFKIVCDDIFKTQDCAIYYTEDMNEHIPELDMDTELGSSNLFVVPVTFRLLTQPNRAMDSDIPYAFRENIPLLPIVVEPGLDDLYALEDKFGQRHYLFPYSTDGTEISYADKLKSYLDSVLTSNEMAKRIRNAFDAHIFLSYRKKDRHYANELMRIIHRNPLLKSTAIWYDEYLIPGDSFVDNIDRVLEDCDLFTLLVTPNILEEPAGKPNFVMEHEYPAAKTSGITIFPVVMEKTSNTLYDKFKELPECVNVNDPNFQKCILETVMRVAPQHYGKARDAEHTFLIGLAYMNGIDVEVNREQGLTMINEAAHAQLPEAMNELFWMYRRGRGVKLDYHAAVTWGERLVEAHLEKQGELQQQAIPALLDLASLYNDLGNFQRALALEKIALSISVDIHGKNNILNCIPFKNLAETYFLMGEYQKYTEYISIVLDEYVALLGNEDPYTIDLHSKLAKAYDRMGNYSKAAELQHKAYLQFSKVCGEDHSYTLNALSELAVTYSKQGDYKLSIKYQEKVYATRRRVLGERHPNTISSLNNLTAPYCLQGNQETAIPLLNKNYHLHLDVLGAEHPDTFRSLSNLANFYGQIGQHKKALPLKKNVYRQFTKTFGPEHHDTLKATLNLGIEYSALGDYARALELLEGAWHGLDQLLGSNHPETQLTKDWISIVSQRLHASQKQNAFNLEQTPYRCRELRDQMEIYLNLDNFTKALDISLKLYDCLCESVGERHPEAIHARRVQIDLYCKLGMYQEAIELAETVYATYTDANEKSNPDIIAVTKKLSYLYKKQGNKRKATEMQGNTPKKGHNSSLLSWLFKKTTFI